MYIGERIRTNREMLKMSQDELAQKVGYKSRSSINKIELGLNEIPQSKILLFSTILNMSPSELMGWEKRGEIKVPHKPYTKFKGWLREAGLTYADISKVLHLTTATVSAKINGASDFYLYEIQMLVNEYNLKIEIFFENVVA